MRRRSAWPRLAAAVASATLAAGSLLPAVAYAGAQPPPASGTIWMISGRSLERLAAFPGTEPLVQEFFASGSDSILVDGDGRSPILALPAQRAVSYASYQTLRRRLTPSGTASLVVLDLEHWPQTPAVEQRDPALYYRLAGELLHQDGLALVAAPSPNIVSARVAANWPSYTAFLASGLIGRIAKSADVFEVQAQGFERSTALYTDFVAAAADQARRANPHVTVIAGLSTNPDGRPVPAAQLYHDVRAARGHVDGFWLNIPARSPACPRCGTPHAGVAAKLLRRLSRQTPVVPSAPPPGLPTADPG